MHGTCLPDLTCLCGDGWHGRRCDVFPSALPSLIPSTLPTPPPRRSPHSTQASTTTVPPRTQASRSAPPSSTGPRAAPPNAPTPHLGDEPPPQAGRHLRAPPGSAASDHGSLETQPRAATARRGARAALGSRRHQLSPSRLKNAESFCRLKF